MSQGGDEFCDQTPYTVPASPPPHGVYIDMCITYNTVVLGASATRTTDKLSRHMMLIDICCAAEQECSECSLSFKVLLTDALTAIP